MFIIIQYSILCVTQCAHLIAVYFAMLCFPSPYVIRSAQSCHAGTATSHTCTACLTLFCSSVTDIRFPLVMFQGEEYNSVLFPYDEKTQNSVFRSSLSPTFIYLTLSILSSTDDYLVLFVCLSLPQATNNRTTFFILQKCPNYIFAKTYSQCFFLQ